MTGFSAIAALLLSLEKSRCVGLIRINVADRAGVPVIVGRPAHRTAGGAGTARAVAVSLLAGNL
jgi:hypothetical protein